MLLTFRILSFFPELGMTKFGMSLISSAVGLIMDSFVVISVYYKHGEFYMEELSSEEDLRGFLEDYIKENIVDESRGEAFAPAHFAKEDIEVLRDGTDNSTVFEKYKLDQLIKIAISIGKKRISRQLGYGVVAVVRGETMN